MKLLFINNSYPAECYDELNANSNGRLQVPSHVFQESVIDGLEKCKVDYTLACVPALPAWPGYRKCKTPYGIIQINGENRGHYLGYYTLPVIKQFSQKLVLKKYIYNWCELNKQEDILAVLSYTQQSEMIGAAIELKPYFRNLVVAPIVTDLIENALDFRANHTFYKRLQNKIEQISEKKIFPKIDRYILLSKYMVESIPYAKGKSIVIEGICAGGRDNIEKEREEGVRTLLYAGTFQEYGGVKLLIDSFLETSDNRFRLVLCGDGVLRDYVEEAQKKDSRIIYKGKVSHEEVVRLQQSSTLLINPRQPNGSITKYSFPSKTMEYMASMTPMIGYHLEGIPEEYYQHMFTPSDLSQDSLTNCINTTLALPIETLQHKAKDAFAFVTMYKNSETQVRRIIDFLKS